MGYEPIIIVESSHFQNKYYESFGGGKVYYGMSLVRPIPPWNGPSSLVG
jgi:hypothetical protein